MTRMKMIEAIAVKQAEEYCENTDKLRLAITTGLIGLVENTNTELEIMYAELFDKPMFIK